AAFGLAPFANVTGFNSSLAGGAAPIDNSSVGPLSMFSSLGIGSLAGSALGFSGIGHPGFPSDGFIGGGASPISGAVSPLGTGFLAGGASGVGGAAATAGALVTGTSAGAGYGRNWVMPAAGIVSGIGG